MCCAVFPCVSVEQPFQDHLLRKNIISTQWALSPRRPNNECAELLPYCQWWMAFWRPSSKYNHPSTNGLFQTIIQVKLNWLHELCFLGDLNNECADSSPKSTMNNLFKIIFWAELSYQCDKLCLLWDLIVNVQGFPCVTDLKFCLQGDLAMGMQICLPSVTNAWPFQDHLPNKHLPLNSLFGTNLQVELH